MRRHQLATHPSTARHNRGVKRSRADPPDEKPRPDRSERPVLPDRPDEERDETWGQLDREATRGKEWYERERPPHHE
jgi:hypothetical protein